MKPETLMRYKADICEVTYASVARIVKDEDISQENLGIAFDIGIETGSIGRLSRLQSSRDGSGFDAGSSEWIQIVVLNIVSNIVYKRVEHDLDEFLAVLADPATYREIVDGLVDEVGLIDADVRIWCSVIRDELMRWFRQRE